MAISAARKSLYQKIAKEIGKTPLIEINDPRFNTHDANRIFAKLEYMNPTGSHYDRYWLRLLQTREEKGVISPSQSFPLLETTTGNSGASFAWACQKLGYKCEVVIPEDMPKSRVQQIKSYGAEIIFSPEKQYVRGLIDHFRGLLLHRRKEYIITNHACDETDGVGAIVELGEEIIEDLKSFHSVCKLDFFISALGNGLTTRFVSKALLIKNPEMKIIGVEPYESPTVYKSRFPDEFEHKFKGKDINALHELLGTGPGETDFHFPNMRAVVNQIEKIYLVKPEEWKMRERQLANFIDQKVGHTSSACLEAAIRHSTHVYNKNFLVIFYDPSWKYTDNYGQEK